MKPTMYDDSLSDVSRFVPTRHARWRMGQWNLSLEDVRFVLEYGQRTHQAGAILVFLRGKDIPDALRYDSWFSRLEGTTLVLSRKAPLVITVYRNRRYGPRNIRRKPPYSRNDIFRFHVHKA